MYLCISKLTVIGSDNDLLPGQRQNVICEMVAILSQTQSIRLIG